MKIGLAIKVGRVAMGLTTLELSEKSGVSTPTIARLENGGNPKLNTINKLFKALDKVTFLEVGSQLVVTINE